MSYYWEVADISFFQQRDKKNSKHIKDDTDEMYADKQMNLFPLSCKYPSVDSSKQ